jgi:ribonuclease P protein component
MQRLRTRGQFKAVLEGRPIARTPHFAWHCLRLDGTPSAAAASTLFPPGNSWLGALAPKRWARRAVRRNLIRRQIHALGDGCDALADSASVIRLRAAFVHAAVPSASSDALKRAVRAELVELLARKSR